MDALCTFYMCYLFLVLRIKIPEDIFSSKHLLEWRLRSWARRRFLSQSSQVFLIPGLLRRPLELPRSVGRGSLCGEWWLRQHLGPVPHCETPPTHSASQPSPPCPCIWPCTHSPTHQKPRSAPAPCLPSWETSHCPHPAQAPPRLVGIICWWRGLG